MTYIGDYVFIKNLSKQKVQAFISNDNGGSDSWHTLTDSFKSGRWGRSGWDVIVFRDEKDTKRKGVYMHIKNITVYITINHFDNIHVEYGRDQGDRFTPLLPEIGLDPWGSDARIHNRPLSSQPYIGDCVLIRNTSKETFRAFVSGHNGGSNSWFTLTNSFKDGRWDRFGWEVIVCRDGGDTWRKGVYVYVKNITVYITVKVVDDVVIEYGRDDVHGGEGEGEGEDHRSEMRESRPSLLRRTFQKGDDESEAVCDDCQPCATELDEQDIHKLDVWA